MISCFFLSLFLDNHPNFLELYKFINSLESYLGIILHIFEENHFIHIIRRNRANYIFLMIFVVPHFIIFVFFSFVYFVKKGKWSWFVDLLSLFMSLMSSCILPMTTIWIAFCQMWYFFLRDDIDTIGIMLSIFLIFRRDTCFIKELF